MMSWLAAAQCQGRHQSLASQAETGTRAPGNATVATHVQATAGHARNSAEQDTRVAVLLPLSLGRKWAMGIILTTAKKRKYSYVLSAVFVKEREKRQ